MRHAAGGAIDFLQQIGPFDDKKAVLLIGDLNVARYYPFWKPSMNPDTEVDRLSRKIYLSVTSPLQWQGVLSEIVQITESSAGHLVWWDARRMATLKSITVGAEIAAMDSKGFVDHERPPGCTGSCRGDVVITHGFCRHIMVTADPHHCFGTDLMVSDDVAVSLALVRPLGRGSYGAAEQSRLTPLRFHLQQALELHRTLQLRQGEMLALRATFDQLLVAMAMVKEDGSVVRLNAAMSDRLQGNFPISVANGRMVASGEAEGLLRRAISAVARGGARGQVVRLDSEAGRFLAIVAPLPVPTEGLASTDISTAVVSVIDPSIGEPVQAVLLRDLYRLTTAETRIVQAMAAGDTVEEIAQASGTQVGTLRNQLRSIYGKTGTSRQAELAALLSRLATVRMP